MEAEIEHSSGSPSNDGSLAALSARHEAMLLDLVAGLPAREIAVKFGMTEGRLSVLRSSPVWKKAEGELRARVREDHIFRLEGLRSNALDAIEHAVVDKTQPGLRLKSALEILNRTGLPAEQASRGEQAESNPVIQLYIPPGWQAALALREASSE